MRVDESIVSRAAAGEREAFASIVRAYEEALYAFCLSSLRSAEDAEDAVQEIFAKALVGLRDLREGGRFESWLYGIARRELSDRARSRERAAGRVELDPEELPDEGELRGVGAREAGAGEELGPLFAALGEDQALAIALRYGAGLSVRETALALGIGEALAKSRLHEAKEVMRRAARTTERRSAAGRRAAQGSRKDYSGFRIPIGLEERIMESIETLRLGSSVLERMAIYDQVRLAQLAAAGQRLDEATLGAMGRIEGGTELIRRCGARLGLREFAVMLNYSSRDTEKRIVEELERVDPPVAEEVKRGTFVFEDFCLFDEGALSLVVAELGEELFARGLSACESRERGMVLARLGSPARARVEALVASLASPPSLSRAAQEEAVALARRLDLEGRIKVLRGEEAGPAGVLLTLAG